MLLKPNQNQYSFVPILLSDEGIRDFCDYYFPEQKENLELRCIKPFFTKPTYVIFFEQSAEAESFAGYSNS